MEDFKDFIVFIFSQVIICLIKRFIDLLFTKDNGNKSKEKD
nr:MAG TPA: hypothetical protein [Caudoviricetes sp.]